MFNHAQPRHVLKHNPSLFVSYPPPSFVLQNPMPMFPMALHFDNVTASQDASQSVTHWNKPYQCLENPGYVNQTSYTRNSFRGQSQPNHQRYDVPDHESSFSYNVLGDPDPANSYESSPFDINAGLQMRPKYDGEEIQNLWNRCLDQNVLLSGSPVSHVADAKDVFDGGSSQTSNTVDTSIPLCTRETTFPYAVTPGSSSDLPLRGYGTACWPKTAAHDTNAAIASDVSYNGPGQNWWHDDPPTSHGGQFPPQNPTVSHDGLPRYSNGSSPNLWHYGPELCTTQMIAINQPQAMSFDAPLAMSTSGSSRGSTYGSYAASSSEHSSQDDDTESNSMRRIGRSEALHCSQSYRIQSPRLRHPRRNVPILPSNDQAFDEYEEEWQPRKNGTRSTMSDPPVSNWAEPLDQSARSRRDPKEGKNRSTRHSWDANTKSSMNNEKRHDRSEKDSFLVQSKLAGMSYKEIRRKGNFTEAESTLRGRYRTLTKHKAARVRKPEWDDNDNRLLRKAVRKFAAGSDPSKAKIPWKEVGKYIKDNGGSYHFGNATCCKHWSELQGLSS